MEKNRKKMQVAKNNKQSKWHTELTLANGVTSIRLFLIPFILYFLLTGKNVIAVILLLIALVSDAVDGYVARKFQQVSQFGKHFDQFIDKTLLLSVLFALLWRESLWIWMGIYGITLPFAIFLSITIVKKKLQVTLVNKITMWLQSIILLVMVVGYVNNITLALFLMLLLITAGDYLRKIQ